MFVNLKTGKPAFLISHDLDVTFSSAPAAEGKPIRDLPSHEFFATHREATPEEIEKAEPAAPVA